MAVWWTIVLHDTWHAVWRIMFQGLGLRGIFESKYIYFPCFAWFILLHGLARLVNGVVHSWISLPTLPPLLSSFLLPWPPLAKFVTWSFNPLWHEEWKHASMLIMHGTHVSILDRYLIIVDNNQSQVCAVSWTWLKCTDVWLEVFFILFPIIIIAHQIYYDTIIISPV